MKHIFTIHSPITFFSACAVIFQEKLAHEDVIIINDGYKVPFKIGKIVDSYQQQEKGIWKKIKNFNLVKAYDQYINELTHGQQFIAYIDLMHAYQRLLITHPNCVKFNFIEEGTASYVVPDNLFFITYGAKHVTFRNKNLSQLIKSIFRIIRGVNIRVLSLPFSPQAYADINEVKFYTFSEHGYPGIKKEKKILLNPHEIDNTVWSNSYYYTQICDEVVWIEESFPRVYKVAEENYSEAILNVVDVLKQKGKTKVLVKLRPKSKASNSFLVDILEKNNIEVEVIPDTIIAEWLFIQANNLQVIGIVSSLLFYASIFGQQSWSFFDTIKEKPNNPFDKMKFYWDAVKKIS